MSRKARLASTKCMRLAPKPFVWCMLRYIYTSVSSLDESIFDGYMERWERHVHVAIIADKYDILALEEAAFKACTATIDPEEDEETFNAPLLISQCSSSHDRHEKLRQIVLDIMQVHFFSVFERADVQDWLDENVEKKEQDCLIIEHFDELIETGYFRQMLRENGEMALQHLERVQGKVVRARQRASLNGGMSWI